MLILICLICTPNHLEDNTKKKHDMSNQLTEERNQSFQNANITKKTPCERYFEDCREPTCALCVKTSHKNHSVTDIETFLNKIKQRINADGRIMPKYRDVSTNDVSSDFDEVVNAIQNQEDTICKACVKLPAN